MNKLHSWAPAWTLQNNFSKTTAPRYMGYRIKCIFFAGAVGTAHFYTWCKISWLKKSRDLVFVNSSFINLLHQGNLNGKSWKLTENILWRIGLQNYYLIYKTVPYFMSLPSTFYTMFYTFDIIEVYAVNCIQNNRQCCSL